MLSEFDVENDIALQHIENKTNFAVASFANASSYNINAYVTELSGTDMMIDANRISTTIPVSAAFRHISNYFFSSSAGTSIPISHDTNSTTGLARIIQIGRTTVDDGLISGSVTAVFSFSTTTADQTFIDIPETSLTSSIGRKGSLVSQSNTSNTVGTVFYDTGTLVFHGGNVWPHFLCDPLSGFYIGTASADKVVCTSLSFKALNVYKRAIFFCRALNKQFNYTTNITALSNQTLGTITGSITANPTTYITSVGLYNDDGDMIAIAKVSPPVKKDFYTEKSVFVKLNY